MEEYKDCSSCKFEPDWKWYSPGTDQQIGWCKNKSAFYREVKIMREKDQDGCLEFFLGDEMMPFFHCPAWAAKDAECQQ